MLAALSGIGCQQMGDQKPAIKKAIETHLSQRSDLAVNQMTMDLQTVTVEGDKAQAEVVFRVTSDPAMQMGYHYDLVRESGAWKVSDGRPSQSDPKHPGSDAAIGDPGGAAALPPGHPPMPESQSPPPGGQSPKSGSPAEGGTLPQGHPPSSNKP